MEQTIIIIEPGKTERQYFKDLWRYKELFYFLSWRDILVRYKQTVIGIIWALVRPFLTMVIFTVVFSKIAKLPSNGVPYPIMVFAALLPWQFFANSLSESSNSLLSNANIISKVYFPRLVLPISAVVTSFVDFLISFFLLIVLMFYYHFTPTWKLCTLPVFIILAVISALGPGFLIAALSVKYRDFKYVVPFIVQFGFFISPVGFNTNVIPEKWRLLYSLNPMVGIIDGFRWAVTGKAGNLYIPGFLISLFLVAALLIYGFRYFRKTEIVFADVI